MRHDEREVDRKRRKIAERAGDVGDVTPLTLGEERMPEGDAVSTCVPRLEGEKEFIIFSLSALGVEKR
jgi:hypothetical protein